MTPEQAYLWAREYLDNPANMKNGKPINEAVHVAAGLVIKYCAPSFVTFTDKSQHKEG